MNPRITANQQRTFLQLFAQVRPHLATDSGVPRRIKDLLGRNRAFGSRDRRLYRELLYTGIRFLPWIEPLLTTHPEFAVQAIAWLAPDLKDTKAFRAAHCSDWPAAPPTLTEKAAILSALVERVVPNALSDEAILVSALGTTRSTSEVKPLFTPASLLPAWFRDECPAAFASPHLDTLNERAPLWVRLQVNDTAHVLAEFSGKGWAPERLADPDDAVRLPPNAEVMDTDAYKRGFVEIQDLGSQLILLHAPVQPGQHWLDACAGAGGKTLQLARLVGDHGRVDATDIRADVLEELRDRADRAKLTNVRILNQPPRPPVPNPNKSPSSFSSATSEFGRNTTKPADVGPEGAISRGRNTNTASPSVPDETGRITTKFSGYDGVLVDAPCSGTGTWRRMPHMKWYTQPAMLAEFAALQLQILSAHAPLVRTGGLLVYATCSLSRRENHDTVAAFLKGHPEFSVTPPARDWGAVSDGHGHTLLPGTRNTDGFYVALLRKSS